MEAGGYSLMDDFYKIIEITNHKGTSRIQHYYLKYIKIVGLIGKIVILERGKSFILDNILNPRGSYIRGFIMQTSPVMCYVYSKNKDELLVGTVNSIYYLKRENITTEGCFFHY